MVINSTSNTHYKFSGAELHRGHPLFPPPIFLFGQGIGDGLGSVAQVEFAQDVADVMLDCFRADKQPLLNFPVGQALGDQCQHFLFPAGQQRGCAPAGMGGDSQFAE